LHILIILQPPIAHRRLSRNSQFILSLSICLTTSLSAHTEIFDLNVILRDLCSPLPILLYTINNYAKQSKEAKGRGSQSRRLRPQSFHASGSPRPRHATSGENPLPLCKQASNSENPQSSPMTWATKLGAKATPTPHLPTPARAALPQTFHTVANDTSAPLLFLNPPNLQLTRRFS